MATLKKIILLALTALIMWGCDNNGKPLGYTYYVLDSCEYISGLNKLAHKGNELFYVGLGYERCLEEITKALKQRKRRTEP